MRVEDTLNTYASIIDLVDVGKINSKELFDLIKEQTKYSDAKIFRQIKKLVKVGILHKSKFRAGIITLDTVFATLLKDYGELSTQAIIIQHLIDTKRLWVMF